MSDLGLLIARGITTQNSYTYRLQSKHDGMSALRSMFRIRERTLAHSPILGKLAATFFVFRSAAMAMLCTSMRCSSSRCEVLFLHENASMQDGTVDHLWDSCSSITWPRFEVIGQNIMNSIIATIIANCNTGRLLSLCRMKNLWQPSPC